MNCGMIVLGDLMKNIKDYIMYVILIALFGQVYFYPFSSDFRFSLSVIFLIIILFYAERVDPLLLSVTSGFMIVTIRSIPLVFQSTGFDLSEMITLHGPAFIYYLVFGILFKLFNIRERVNKNYYNIALIIIVDSLSNIVELLLREGRITMEFDLMILAIVLVALLRTILISVLVYALEINKIKHQKEKFKDLIFINAGLNSEIFYLEKSTIDIEHAMEISYKLYEEINDEKIKERALELSKNIHEIKKDYKRVIDGINFNIEKSLRYQMDFEELITIIKENSKKQVFQSDKKIKLIFKNKDNFIVHHYYSLITVINNLIINAIDAIEDQGQITCSEFSDDQCIYIKIEDNGIGIPKEEIDVIFEPGFTTKFNMETGEMSSGIGLIHVKNIVENVFEGQIKVTSTVGEETIFLIKIQKYKMEE